MGELPYSRGQRVGTDASIAQQDERARTRRELSTVQESGFSPVVYTQDCLAEYNKITEVDPTNGALSVQLPTAVTPHPVRIRIKNVSASANNIIVNPWGEQKIDGAASLTLAAARAYINLAANARRKEWVVLCQT